MKPHHPTPAVIACSACHIGQMRRRSVTHFTFIGGLMITVPDFPAWQCDICRKCEYDVDALDSLALLLNPPPQPKRPARRLRHAVDAHLAKPSQPTSK